MILLVLVIEITQSRIVAEREERDPAKYKERKEASHLRRKKKLLPTKKTKEVLLTSGRRRCFV